MEGTKLGPLVASSNRNGTAIELCRTLLSPDTRGALKPFNWPKAPRAAKVAHESRANHCAPPPSVPPFPSGARARSMPKNPEETGFLAGAALAARHAGHTEDEAALRPATAGAMPGICAGRVTIPDPRDACCKPGGGSPNGTRCTK
jgi:hypothetical protein